MYDKELQLALRLARKAGPLILHYYRRRSRVMMKANETPVTAADRAVERVLTDGIRAVYPRDRIVGEEHGSTGGHVGRFWTIDPIDGTSHFIRKTGFFATMISLIVRGRPVIGVVYAPALRKLFYAHHGHGAHVVHGKHRASLHVPRPQHLADARLAVPLDAKKRSTLSQRSRDALTVRRRVRLGSIGLSVCAIAEGRADVYIGASTHTGIWDIAPIDSIITEAGGACRIFTGQPVPYRWGQPAQNRGFIATSPSLLPAVLSQLRDHGIPALVLKQRRMMMRRTSQNR